MNITIKAVHKRFGGFTALDGVDLDIASGELLALLGPSGSGKTTLLRAIAGLEPIDAGRILFDEVDATRLSVQQRRAGFVFQHYALFKHMNVLDNVTFGLRMQARGSRPSQAEIARRGLELLDLVQLSGLAERYPTQLSGGQRQRVALARALAIRPRVLLLDEPFGALDAKVRADLRRWLRQLHKDTGYTTIFVTHDQEEALELADRIVIMNHGKLEQIGTVDQVYEHPATPFVFDFLGGTNVIPAELQGRRLLLGGTEIAATQDSIHPSGPVDVYVRPGDLRVAPEQTAGIDIQLQSVQRTGPTLRAVGQIEASQTALSIELPHLHHDVSHFVAGARLRLRLMQFSIYPRSQVSHGSSSEATPVLIGRERVRARL